jgi:hypothetical protein
MRTFLIALGTVAVIIAGAAVFVWSGIYNMAATEPHWDITYNILEVARDRSISVHSKGLVAPSLSDPKLELIGASHFHHTCRLCHGAPGHPRSEFSVGLYPSPPSLVSDEVRERNDAGLFWILKNGIKMTGMPAFGVTDDDEELWGTVALLRRLPKLKAEEYNELVKAGSSVHGHEHSHQ